MREHAHAPDTRVPEMLRSGGRLHGIFHGIPPPAIAEMCPLSGFDFMLIDNEHGSASIETTEHLLRAARPNDLAHNMGFENRWNEPPVQTAIERTRKAVAGAGKCPGIQALTREEEERYAGSGARYFATVTTGIITRALKEAAQGGRAQLNY